jgi:hypothetical protein
MNPRSNLEHSSCDGWLRLNRTNRYAPLNPGQWSRQGRSSAILLRFNVPMKQSPRGGTMAYGKEGSKSHCTTPITKKFLPTRSRWEEESTLPAYSCGYGRWRAGNGEAVRATLADGGGAVWWSSDSGEGSGVGSGDWWPSKKKFGVEHSLEVGQHRWLCSMLAMGKNYWGGAGKVLM